MEVYHVSPISTEARRLVGLGMAEGCELLGECWELNQSPLQKQPALLNTAVSSQALFLEETESPRSLGVLQTWSSGRMTSPRITGLCQHSLGVRCLGFCEKGALPYEIHFYLLCLLFETESGQAGLEIC